MSTEVPIERKGVGVVYMCIYKNTYLPNLGADPIKVASAGQDPLPYISMSRLSHQPWSMEVPIEDKGVSVVLYAFFVCMVPKIDLAIRQIDQSKQVDSRGYSPTPRIYLFW